MSNLQRSKILIQMTGSIACFKACALISKLVQAGHHVKVVTSKSALQFIGAATLEGLTGEKVVHDLWETGEAMAHIHLMRWADLIAVVPASAHYLNRAALGIGDDLLTTMFLAHDFKKPFLVAPAMNTSMYLHPATQKSIHSLKEMGVEILESASGVLACGEIGYGRLLEPDLLLQEIESRLPKSVLKNSARRDSNNVKKAASFRVLVTSGGTQEPIDGVRVFTNLSTGATGAELVDRLESLGFSVVHVLSESAISSQVESEKIRFQTSAQLADCLRDRFSRGDIAAVIHLAAVSDFVLSNWEQQGISHPADGSGKISSHSDLTLHLKRNQKILAQIREWSPRPLHLTAFKMTSHAGVEQIQLAVEKVFATGKPDWVVHNDTTGIDRAGQSHKMSLYQSSQPGTQPLELNSRAGLAEQLAIQYSRILTDDQRGNP